ncbi:MAG: hypothetical protein FJ088_16250, partial [Deltaproteobacteria bacterium]|nr:hypothetical protein [Deltaproteobacteria bacterium]
AGGIRENDSVFIGDEPREKIAAILNSKSFLRDPEHRSLIDHLSGRLIEDYIALDLDYVLRFHSKEHAGFPGASIWKAIPNGRVADADSLGWNVLMRYPEVDSKNPVPEEIGSIISCGDALVLAASRLCFLRGIRFAAPYSRPAGFRKTLLDAVSRKGGSNAAAGNFAEFQEKVREVLSEIRR